MKTLFIVRAILGTLMVVVAFLNAVGDDYARACFNLMMSAFVAPELWLPESETGSEK